MPPRIKHPPLSAIQAEANSQPPSRRKASEALHDEATPGGHSEAEFRRRLTHEPRRHPNGHLRCDMTFQYGTRGYSQIRIAPKVQAFVMNAPFYHYEIFDYESARVPARAMLDCTATVAKQLSGPVICEIARYVEAEARHHESLPREERTEESTYWMNMMVYQYGWLNYGRNYNPRDGFTERMPPFMDIIPPSPPPPPPPPPPPQRSPSPPTEQGQQYYGQSSRPTTSSRYQAAGGALIRPQSQSTFQDTDSRVYDRHTDTYNPTQRPREYYALPSASMPRSRTHQSHGFDDPSTLMTTTANAVDSLSLTSRELLSHSQMGPPPPLTGGPTPRRQPTRDELIRLEELRQSQRGPPHSATGGRTPRRPPNKNEQNRIDKSLQSNQSSTLANQAVIQPEVAPRHGLSERITLWKFSREAVADYRRSEYSREESKKDSKTGLPPWAIPTDTPEGERGYMWMVTSEAASTSKVIRWFHTQYLSIAEARNLRAFPLWDKIEDKDEKTGLPLGTVESGESRSDRRWAIHVDDVGFPLPRLNANGHLIPSEFSTEPLAGHKHSRTSTPRDDSSSESDSSSSPDPRAHRDEGTDRRGRRRVEPSGHHHSRPEKERAEYREKEKKERERKESKEWRSLKRRRLE